MDDVDVDVVVVVGVQPRSNELDDCTNGSMTNTVAIGFVVGNGNVVVIAVGNGNVAAVGNGVVNQPVDVIGDDNDNDDGNDNDDENGGNSSCNNNLRAFKER